MRRGRGDAVSRLRTPSAVLWNSSIVPRTNPGRRRSSLRPARPYSAVCGGRSLDAALSRAVAAMMLALS